MSSIIIKKISILDLDVDCIVNAANSGLQAGGGVCGAIFRAAGYRELQNACDRIGHCDTGSAVITDAFDLKQKYIIHAVGPIWRGGHSNEEKLLRGAYTRSLQLAKENGCTSIGFPLISAGIFGYPQDQAWRVALEACFDFLKETQENQKGLDIYFAVLDDRILKMGEAELKKQQGK